MLFAWFAGNDAFMEDNCLSEMSYKVFMIMTLRMGIYDIW